MITDSRLANIVRVLAAEGLIVLAALLPSYAIARPISRCVIEVGGTVYLDGPCNFERFDDGGFSIGTSDLPPRVSPYFAYVNKDGAGSSLAEGYWNEEPANTHAHTPLGQLKQAGACWVNDTARVCAYR